MPAGLFEEFNSILNSINPLGIWIAFLTKQKFATSDSYLTSLMNVFGCFRILQVSS